MRFCALGFALVLAACGATQFNTRDPYVDGGVGEDAGTEVVDAGPTGGGGGSLGGGGGGGGSLGGGSGGGGGGGSAMCGAANCASGCCRNNVCESGTSTTDCGTGGTMCATCVTGDLCTSNACAINPASTWRVLISALTMAPSNGGIDWDDLSDPDPKWSVWCPATGSLSATSTTASDTFNATWTTGGCTTAAGGLLTDGLGYSVLEADAFSDDTVIPFTALPITEADLRAGMKTQGPRLGTTSMTFRFTRQ